MTFVLLELLLLPILGIGVFVLVWGLRDLYQQRQRKTAGTDEMQPPTE